MYLEKDALLFGHSARLLRELALLLPYSFSAESFEVGARSLDIADNRLLPRLVTEGYLYKRDDSYEPRPPWRELIHALVEVPVLKHALVGEPVPESDASGFLQRAINYCADTNREVNPRLMLVHLCVFDGYFDRKRKPSRVLRVGVEMASTAYEPFPVPLWLAQSADFVQIEDVSERIETQGKANTLYHIALDDKLWRTDDVLMCVPEVFLRVASSWMSWWSFEGAELLELQRKISVAVAAYNWQEFHLQSERGFPPLYESELDLSRFSPYPIFPLVDDAPLESLPPPLLRWRKEFLSGVPDYPLLKTRFSDGWHLT